MRIAVSGRSLAGRRIRPDIFYLYDLIDIWHSAGNDVVFIQPPDLLIDPPDCVELIHAGSRIDPAGPLRSAVWGDTRLAAEAGAEVMFIPEPAAPLISPLPVVAGYFERLIRPMSITERIRMAIGRAGLRGASGLLTFDDLPQIVQAPPSLRRLPPFVGSSFENKADPADVDRLGQLGLTPGYCLSFAGSADELRVLMAAWSWVAGALGEECTLVIVGGDEVVDERVDTLGVAEGVEQTIRWIERVSFAMLPALYRGAGVLMSAGSPSTGQELRWALACGLPIAAIETPKTAAVVGGAAYLIHSLDTRALGAACLTVVVNADVADDLRRLGLSRAGAYHDPSAQQAWTEALRSIVNSART